jgi:hypothetical protein
LDFEESIFSAVLKQFLKGERSMRSLARIISVLVLCAGTMTVRTNAVPGGGAEAFEKLKSLVGHWETDKTNMNKATLDLELTSGGTAVLEKFHMIENGKPVEMTTLYFLDGDQVKLTHYCMAGNQPTMKGSYAPETKTITFDFVGATNLKTADDGHMHHAVYTFIDNDHFKTTWTFRKEQKDAFTEDVTYVRTK